MKVLLINPPYPMEEYPIPPLGLTYLAAILLKEGCEVEILDLLVSGQPGARLRAKLKEFEPQLVGATCSTMNYPTASKLLRLSKEIRPEATTLIGGPHVTYTAEDTLREAPWIDFVIRGEAEETIVELVQALAAKGDLSDVAGIAYRRDDRPYTTATRPVILDLDRLPFPARHLLPLHRYHALRAHCTVITSRGCPFHCIFCSAPQMFGRKVRYRDPLLVVDEIEMLVRDLGFGAINVVDDTFTVNRQHVEKICDEIVARGIKVELSIYSRVDTISPALLTRLKDAGCRWICFGIESGSPEILKTIEKGITLQQAELAMEHCRASEINSLASFILGLPGETPETVERTVSFARHLGQNYGAAYGFHILAPMPGTPVRDQAEAYGIRILTSDWERYNANEPVAEPVGFSGHEILRIVAGYEADVAKFWQQIEADIVAGDLFYKDRFDERRTQTFVWKLLKSDLLEELAIREEKMAGSLPELAQRLADPTGFSPAETLRQLELLATSGHLHYASNPYAAGNDHWQWVESIVR